MLIAFLWKLGAGKSDEQKNDDQRVRVGEALMMGDSLL
jgi:hypothetical protein